MRFLKKLFVGYLDSSIHVALAVCAWLQLTFLELGITQDLNLTFFTFFATVTAYNFVRYGLWSRRDEGGATWFLVWIRFFSVCCGMGLLFFAFRLASILRLWVGVLVVMTLWYVWPFVFGQTLRRIPRLKIFVIASCWTIITVFLPSFQGDFFGRLAFWSMALQRFLWVVVLMIPFEIRDLKYDHPTLQTLPQQLGIKGAKLLAILLLLVIVVLQACTGQASLGVNYELLCIVGVMLFMIMSARASQSPYYASFWVESLPILWYTAHVGVRPLFG